MVTVYMKSSALLLVYANMILIKFLVLLRQLETETLQKAEQEPCQGLR